MPGWAEWISQVITIGVFYYFLRDLKTDIRDLRDKVFDLGIRVSRVEGLLEARSEQKDDRHS